MTPLRADTEADAIEREVQASNAMSLTVLLAALIGGGAVLAVSALLASL